jgi:hypothetical protein
MRMMHLMAVLMLVPTLGLPMTAPARAKTSLARASTARDHRLAVNRSQTEVRVARS